MLKHRELNCRDIKGPCTICICGFHPAGMVLVYRQMKGFRLCLCLLSEDQRRISNRAADKYRMFLEAFH